VKIVVALVALFLGINCCIAAIPSFDSADQAAKAALGEVTTISESKFYEFGGLIYKHAGRFYYSTPYSSLDDKGFKIVAKIPAAAAIIAVYHNHPKVDAHAEYFSPDDVKVATDMHVLSYIYVNASQEIRRFDPDQARLVKIEKTASGGRVSLGTVVDSQ